MPTSLIYNKNQRPPAIFLMGATASGKTELAVQLAQQLDTEIISVDSVQVYRGMNIGTAKPTLEETKGIPHHLIDILDPSETFSTGNFRQSALQIMDNISKSGKIPLLTGGTMLYFSALFNGLASLPEANSELRKKLTEELKIKGKTTLYTRLKSIDPESAQRIHPNDSQRIQRALEVYELSGKPMTQFFREAAQESIPYRKIKLILLPSDRKLLHEKIAKRFQSMIGLGLLEEVESLYQRGGLTDQLPAIRAVGYRQAWSYMQGEYDLETMIEKAIIATRQLAKRQLTWLRQEQDAMKFVCFEKNLSKKVFQAIKDSVAS